MVEFSTSKGRTFLVDDEDADFVSGHVWHTANKGYLAAKIGGRFRNIHRVLMGLPVGDRRQVDHVNRDPSDNRKCNLRISDASGNAQNRAMVSNNSSGFKGVHRHAVKSTWIAQIAVNGKKIYLGSFPDPISAAHAYDRASIEFHGEFGVTNRELGLVDK